MITDQLFQVLYGLHDFPDSLKPDTIRGKAFRERVDNLVVATSFPADRILLSAGQREETMYFLDQGFARGYLYDPDSGAEDTRFLWKASSFVVSPQSFYQQLPSELYIQVCAGSRVISATFKDMEDTFAEFPEGEIMTRSVSLQYLEMQDWRNQMISKRSSRERYEILLQEFPGIMQHFKAEVIASYLNMARETLSRLRKLAP